MKKRNIDEVILRINKDRETIESTYWRHIPSAIQSKILMRYKGNIHLAVNWFAYEVFKPIYEITSFIWNIISDFLRWMRDSLISMNLGGQLF